MTEPTKAKGGARAGAGRPKGSPNKVNGELKEMILGALERAGGVTYLTSQAKKNPKAFLTLLGKVLPMTIQGTGDGGAITVEITRFGPNPPA